MLRELVLNVEGLVAAQEPINVDALSDTDVEGREAQAVRALWRQFVPD